MSDAIKVCVLVLQNPQNSGSAEVMANAAVALARFSSGAAALVAADPDAWGACLLVLGAEGGVGDDNAAAGALVCVLATLYAHSAAQQGFFELSNSPIALGRLVLEHAAAAQQSVANAAAAVRGLLFGCLRANMFAPHSWQDNKSALHWLALAAQADKDSMGAWQLLVEQTVFELRWERPNLPVAARRACLIARTAGGPTALSSAGAARVSAEALGRVSADFTVAEALACVLFAASNSHNLALDPEGALAHLVAVPLALTGLVLLANATTAAQEHNEAVVVKARALLEAALKSLEAIHWLRGAATNWLVRQLEGAGESRSDAARLCGQLVHIAGGPAALFQANAVAICSNAALCLQQDDPDLANELQKVVIASAGSVAGGDEGAARALALMQRPLFQTGTKLALQAEKGVEEDEEEGIASPFCKLAVSHPRDLHTLNTTPPWMRRIAFHRNDLPAQAQESAQHEQEPAAEEAEAPTPAVALRRDDLPARAQEPEIAPIAPAPTAAPPTPTAAHVSSVGDDQEMTVELLGLMLEAALPSPGPLSEPESCLLVSADGDNLLTLFDAAASSALQCMHCCEVMPTIEELKAHEEECEDGICLHCKEPWYTKRAKARQQLVACDACNGWLHLSCTPYKSLKQATDDGYFSCNACAQANKPPEMPSGARQASCQYTSDTDTDSDTWA